MNSVDLEASDATSISKEPKAFDSNDNQIVEAEKQKPVKYPKAVAFIISNEFCERFNYYGMRTILVLYLTNKLGYNEETATVLFHTFTMLVYIFPLVGALIADGWLGKYKTILYLSLVYSIGAMIVSFGAIPLPDVPTKLVTIVGLLLIAIGTGGIKPCVSAFGGDQFTLPDQAMHLAKFFSLFYFAINAGSMISTTVTPILRADVHCFGEDDCFSLAFGVPAVLMIISVLVFVAGQQMYKRNPPTGNMIFGVTQTIAVAYKRWRSRDKNSVPKEHFLDYAEETVGAKMVHDVKCLVKILILYLPFPIFWALFDQQGSRWTFQATRMDGELWGYTIKPDQMQVINPLLILTFIPLFDYVIYPMLSVIGIRRPLQKLTIGGLLAALAFLLSAAVEMRLEIAEPAAAPSDVDMAHLRLYNGMPCRYEFTSDVGSDIAGVPRFIEPLGMWSDLALYVPEPKEYNFMARVHSRGALNCPSIEGKIKLKPGKSVSYFIANDKLQEFSDGIDKMHASNGNSGSFIRTLVNTPPGEGPIVLRGTGMGDTTDGVQRVSRNISALYQVPPGGGALDINGRQVAKFETRNGGLYSLLVQGSDQGGYTYNMLEVVPPATISMMWQLPQIVVITAAEIMFSVTGLEFSFTQAPASMKSVLQACWLLAVAIGNMIVVVIAEIKFVDSQSAEFALFAGIMFMDMLLFLLLARSYTYTVYNNAEENINVIKAKPPQPQERISIPTVRTKVEYEADPPQLAYEKAKAEARSGSGSQAPAQVEAEADVQAPPPSREVAGHEPTHGAYRNRAYDDSLDP
ncbi:peptide transporter family 1 isoform X2 [Scaptodrosophila lebanonensis]|uniref:Oligopeptide transporter 1 n=1 Tax=Drosophila lebanonensis TaxID=7225 RepID=A0A6J2TZ14_DROLE|nr:peptide transporter family 1 isoform X2 [Scaptodrosophila lebanonensis]